MVNTDLRTGRCLCGSVRVETRGTPDRVLNCHCNSCRKHTGAPMATLAVFRPEQVSFAGGSRKAFESSEGVFRSFCPECGSPLTWEASLGDEGMIWAVHVSIFDAPESLPPTGHSFYGDRIDWFDAADALPRFSGFVRGAEPIGHGPADFASDNDAS